MENHKEGSLEWPACPGCLYEILVLDRRIICVGWSSLSDERVFLLVSAMVSNNMLLEIEVAASKTKLDIDVFSVQWQTRRCSLLLNPFSAVPAPRPRKGKMRLAVEMKSRRPERKHNRVY